MGLEVNPRYVEQFDSTVFEDVQREMTRNCADLKKQMGKQRVLRRKIIKLRLTKYPVLLLKKLAAHCPQGKIISVVFAISGHSSKTRGSLESRHPEDIYLILTSEKYKEALDELACKFTSKPPLSKFGIDPKMRLLTIEEFVEKERKSPSFDHNCLWLYANGVTNMFVERLSFGKWVDLAGSGEWAKRLDRRLPPLITDVKIKQQVPTTWSSRDSLAKE